MTHPDVDPGLEIMREDLRRELELEKELDRASGYRYRIQSFAPNPRQWDFCCAGGGDSPAHEIMLSGTNQVGGKTYTLQYMIAIHATGLYPPEWEGPRFTKPPHLAIAGETAHATRDQIYYGTKGDDATLFGMPPEHEGGWIPKDCYNPETDLVNLKGSYDNLLDYAEIDWHDADGVKRGKSTLRFFGYAKGWKKIQGMKYDGIFLNELPPDDVYNEMRGRIGKTMGYIWVVCCMKGGETETYLLYESDESGQMVLLNYTLDDCTHLTKENYDFYYNMWIHHPHAEALIWGRPCRGAGVVYPYPRRLLVEPPFRAQELLPQIIGVDFPHGTGVFAALKGVLEPERDILHIVDEVKLEGQETPVYIDRLLGMGGARIPIAWPHDGGRGFGETTSGGSIAEKYRAAGLRMMKSSAFVYDHLNRKSKAVMTAVELAQDRMSSGRLKISQNCRELLEEIRLLRHEKGQIVKRRGRDDLIDAMHKMLMMLRYARPPASVMAESNWGKVRTPASRGDYNFFG